MGEFEEQIGWSFETLAIHGAHGADTHRRQGGFLGFAQPVDWCLVSRSRRIECGISKDPESSPFDQCGRSADVGDRRGRVPIHRAS